MTIESSDANISNVIKLFLGLPKDQQLTIKVIIDELVKHNYGSDVSSPTHSNIQPPVNPHFETRAKKEWGQVKNLDGQPLANSIHEFCARHDPPIKYEGMRTCIDVLTSCWDLNRRPHDFHYEVDKFKRAEGVYIVRKAGQGHRTTEAVTDYLYDNGTMPK